MYHRKKLSFLSSFGPSAVFVKGSKIAVFISIRDFKIQQRDGDKNVA